MNGLLLLFVCFLMVFFTVMVVLYSMFLFFAYNHYGRILTFLSFFFAVCLISVCG